MIQCVETANVGGLGHREFLMFRVNLVPRHLQVLVAVTSQGGVAGVASKWQQVPVAMVNLGSLGMAPEQAVLRRRLPSMQ